MVYITFRNAKLDSECDIAEDVPKEAEKVGDIGDCYDQFQDLDDKANVDHHSNFILISLLVIPQNRIIFHNLLQTSFHNQFNLSHNHRYIKKF